MIYHLILGSNMDEPNKQVREAINRIIALPEITLLRMSRIDETDPYGFTYQNKFINQILELESTLTPQQMLDKVLQIENDMGRVRHIKWGPRNIDIDILLAEDAVIETNTLSLPHPDLPNRFFALDLLCDLIPEKVHPILHKTMQELRDDLKNNGGDR